MSDNTINVRELVEQAEKEGLLVERAQFVRDAAIRIYASARQVHEYYDYETAWYQANRLWEAKPSDC